MVGCRLPFTRLTDMCVLKATFFIYILQEMVSGQGDALDQGGYSVATAAYCVSPAECDTAGRGQTCLWLYDGCERGRCMCDPRSQIEDSTGRCRPIQKGGEYCDETNICIEGMECRLGRCRCRPGTTITPDKRFCLQPTDRLLGWECRPDTDRCLQKPPYSLSYTNNKEVVCSSRGECTCGQGLKQDGLTCRKWMVGESGCTKAYHCQGGAVCLEGRCDCPTGYRPTTDNLKCAKVGAETELGIGEACDEINEQRYCAPGLVCYNCGGRQRYQCVKFLITDDQYPHTNSADHSAASSILLLTTASVVSSVLSRIIS